MDKLKYIKIEKADGSLTDSIPITADAINITMANGNSVEDTLNNKANTTDLNNLKNNLESQIRIIASGSPRGVYETSAALKAANPETGVYIASGNGHIYSWTKNSTSNPIDLGIYQAAEDSETVNQLKNDSLKYIEKHIGINRFNKNTAKKDTFYKNQNGTVVEGSSNGYYCFLLPVEKDKIYTVSGTSYSTLCVGDNMEYLGYSWNSGITTFDTSSLARKNELKYLAISFRTTTAPLDTYMAVEGDALPSEYVAYFDDYSVLKNIVVPSSLIEFDEEIGTKIYTIKKDGTGDYVNFTECIKALKNDTREKIIYIEAGTYDLFEEIGGTAFALSIPSDATDWKLYNDIVPANTKIIGLGKVIFNFKPTQQEISSVAAGLLSPLNVAGSVCIENIEIDADNCRYCIHDEASGIEEFDESTHFYKNVKLKKKRTNYGIDCAFGCGFNRGEVFDFDNCIFKSNSRALSMHNRTNTLDNTLVNIKNSAFISNSKALNFRNTNPNQTLVEVNVINSYVDGSIVVQNETATERPNAFDVTLIGCGNQTVTVENATNIYTPTVYDY